ncbi:MAG: Cytidylate kinase [Syntrophus sp. PtaU1.Bin208]|nr:MAG: Cytidylate kinase [Syntrophus sp. PtaU1.Bin208]
MGKKLLITIDGPAGAGKSTVSKALARILSYLYLDTGSLYRAIAYKIKKEKKDSVDAQFLANLSNSLNLHLLAEKNNLKIILDDVDITDLLRTEELGLLASRISAIPIIRETLLPIQRQFGTRGGMVAEGRDMGTVVFPDADLKYYLTATLDERVRRRHKELMEAGNNSDIAEIRDQMILRDGQDMERLIAPLKVPTDAVVIDSTGMTIGNVVAAITHDVKLRQR